MSVPNRCVRTVLPVPISPVMRTLGLVVPGLSMTDRKSSARNRSWFSRWGRRGGNHSRLNGPSSLDMVGLGRASLTISEGAERAVFSIMANTYTLEPSKFTDERIKKVKIDKTNQN